MQVSHINYTPKPEFTIAITARASSSSSNIDEFSAKSTPEQIHSPLLPLRAQREIVQLFERVKEAVQQVASFIGAGIKPKCYRLGYCDELENCGLFPLKSAEAGIKS